MIKKLKLFGVLMAVVVSTLAVPAPGVNAEEQEPDAVSESVPASEHLAQGNVY